MTVKAFTLHKRSLQYFGMAVYLLVCLAAVPCRVLSPQVTICFDGAFARKLASSTSVCPFVVTLV